MMKRIPVILAMAVLAAGCADKSADDAAARMQEGADMAKDAAAEATDMAGDAMDETADAAMAMVDENGMVTVAGTVGCGHCNYGMGESCSAAMKSADGTVYLLEGVDETPVFEERKSGKAIQVVGVAKEVDGVKTIVVETWEM